VKVPGAALPAAAGALRLLTEALAATWRVQKIEGREHLARALDPPAMLACWHEQTFLSVSLVRRLLLPAGGPVSILASQSNDGELSARIARAWGIRVTRGSTSRGGREAALLVYRELRQERSTVLVMPDGPIGPARRAKPGCVALAATTGAPIVPVGLAASRRIRLKSWDRMIVGMPFSRLVFAAGEPIVLNRATNNDERAKALRELDVRLDALTRRAGLLLSDEEPTARNDTA